MHRYYVCQTATKQGAAACPTRSVPATKIEGIVVAQIRRIGSDPELRRQTFESALAQVAAERRGLKAEAKRLDRDLATAKADRPPRTGARRGQRISRSRPPGRHSGRPGTRDGDPGSAGPGSGAGGERPTERSSMRPRLGGL